jgi:glycosyltransferase involved in cell wall biosynthesis
VGSVNKLSNLDSFAIVVPAYNEAKSIAQVLDAVAEYGIPIVVDDGSIDETSNICRAIGVVLVVHERNRGYDAALESGLFKAIELGFDFAITVDADGQHNVSVINDFKRELSSGADLVVGVRDKCQRFSEKVFSVVGYFLWGIRDPLCGMKGYKLDVLLRARSFSSYDSIGTEFSVRCAKSDLQIASLPVLTRSRVGESRFGSGLISNVRIIIALLKVILFSRPFKSSNYSLNKL